MTALVQVWVVPFVALNTDAGAPQVRHCHALPCRIQCSILKCFFDIVFVACCIQFTAVVRDSIKTCMSFSNNELFVCLPFGEMLQWQQCRIPMNVFTQAVEVVS